MKIPVYQLADLSSGDGLKNLNNIIMRLTHAINSIELGNLSGGNENIWCTIITAGMGSADEICSAAHGLKRVPTGTIILWQDKAAVLYKPTAAESADTSTAIYYTFDTASTSAVLLLI